MKRRKPTVLTASQGNSWYCNLLLALQLGPAQWTKEQDNQDHKHRKMRKLYLLYVRCPKPFNSFREQPLISLTKGKSPHALGHFLHEHSKDITPAPPRPASVHPWQPLPAHPTRTGPPASLTRLTGFGTAVRPTQKDIFCTLFTHKRST